MQKDMLSWGVGFALVLGGAGAAAEPIPLLSPTPTPLPLTSTFGEYRQGHYHGGLDFSTGGKEGVPVLAPQDGWVFRVRASGIGYGRAVYYRLEDGRTVLYAHLSRFNPRIQELVEAEQDRLRRYEVDFTPEAGAVSFQAGDVLGQSGQSGAGPPHLHAEVREGAAAAVAVNPLGLGWSVADTIAPRITGIRIEPAEAGARVNGNVEPVVVADPLGPPVILSGPVRIWAECSDRASKGSYRLAPHVVRGSLDGNVWSEVRLDRFHWNWAREVEWTFHNERARTANERWVSLQPPPRSRQEINRAGEGFPSLTPGTHRMEIEAVDGNGNRALFPLNIVVEQTAEGAPLTTPAPKEVELESRGSFLELRVPGEEPLPVVGVSPDGQRWAAGWTTLAAPGGWIHQFGEPRPAVSGLWSFYVRRGESEELIGNAVWTHPKIRSGDAGDSTMTPVLLGRVALGIVPESTYGPQWITVHQDDAVPAMAGSEELSPVGGTIRLGPWAWPFRERVRVELTPPPGESRRGVAVYSRTRRGWTFEGADTTGRGVAAKIGNLEDLTLFRDDTPPRIRLEIPERGGREIFADIADDGVGVRWRGIEMILNGRTVVAEWDPEGDRLIGYLRRPLDPGEHEIVVSATDRVGNRTVKRIAFALPE